MKCWLISQQESSHQYRNIYLSLQNISQEIAQNPHIFPSDISSRHHFWRPPCFFPPTMTKQPGPPPVVPSSPQPRRSSRSAPQGRSPSDTIRRRLSLPDMATMGPWDQEKNLGTCGNSWWERPCFFRWKYEVNSEKMEENDDSLWGGLAKPCESHGKIGSELMLIQFWGEWTLKETGNSLVKPTKIAECKAKKTGSELRKLGINPSSDAAFWLRKWKKIWVPAAVDERMVRRFQ